jgi:hypothetical protein
VPSPGYVHAESIKFHCEEKLLNRVRPDAEAVARRRPATLDELCDALGKDISSSFLQL